METPAKQWTIKERTWCVQEKLKGRKNKDIQARFLQVFQKEKAPCKQRLHAWVKKFGAHGTVENLNKKSSNRKTHSGRKRVRDEAIIQRVRQDVQESPKRSTRKRSQSLSLDRCTLRRILKEDLGMFPYHIQTMQFLSTDDRRRRQKMAEDLMEKIEVQKSFLECLMTSDEAHFELDGSVNSHNNVFWGIKPPIEVAQKPLHSPRVTVWCAVWSKGIVGPYFFEDERGHTATVTKERYVAVLNQFYSDLKVQHPGYLDKIWFQQDGATPHTALISLAWLKEHFKSRVITSTRGAPYPIEWAPHSPDLSPPDFFLWGYLKDRVYQDKPRTLKELKKRIVEACKAIKPEVFKDVMNNFCLRLKRCKDLKGGHLEHML